MNSPMEPMPMPDGRFTIVLAKEDFKFSCAHFTLFSRDEAELLHGHNYQVSVEVAGHALDSLGILVDFERVKRAIRARCAELDSRMLVPASSPLLTVREDGDDVEVTYGPRHYRFPAADVLMLPLVNTTVELFAGMLWQRLAPTLEALPGVDTLQVTVGETAGQSCAFGAALRPD